MITKKILSLAASITKLFIFLVFLSSNSNAEENNSKYYSDDLGTISLMYHRFNEDKYPSTNIEMDILKKQMTPAQIAKAQKLAAEWWEEHND